MVMAPASGAGKGSAGPGRSRRLTLALVDYLVSVGLLAPLVVSYWRGTWQLLDANFFATRPLLSAWSSVGVGSGLQLFFYWMQEDLHRLVVLHAGGAAAAGEAPGAIKGGSRWRFLLSSRMYTAIFCFASVNQWRGVWKALDVYWGTGTVSAATSAAIGLALLATLGALRNVLAPPLGLLLDLPDSYFLFPTMFRTQKEEGGGLHLLDCVFSVGMVGSLVVFAWRGAWELLDIFMFPGRPHMSAWGSLALGYSTSLLALALQHPMGALSLRIPRGRWRLILMDTLVALGFFGAVNLWRGVWNLSNLILLPQDPDTSNWISHGAGLVVLVLLQGGNSILVRGVLLDSDLPHQEHQRTPEDEPEDPVFSVQYLRHFVAQARKKRRWMKRRRKGEEAGQEEPELMVKMLPPMDGVIVGKDIPNNLQQHPQQQQQHFPEPATSSGPEGDGKSLPP